MGGDALRVDAKDRRFTRGGCVTFGLVALLCVAFAGYAELSQPERGSQRQRMPDGSTIELLGTTYGNHRFVTGVRWQKLLWPVLPPGPRAKLDSITEQYPLAPRPNALILWTRHSGEDSGSPVEGRITSVDEHGCELGTDSVAAYGVGVNRLVGRRGRLADPWMIEVFPRRASGFAVSQYHKDGPEHWTRVARFVVGNPDKGPHPTWNPAPVPISKRVGPLSFELLGFRHAFGVDLVRDQRGRVTSHGRALLTA